jgi:multidrug efflux pump subunit AcrA (membrane-fusion protein)
MKRIALAVTVIVALLGTAALVYGVPGLAQTGPRVPTTHPERGDLQVRIYTRGELSAEKSMAVSAPGIGGTMQIVHLAPAGSIVRAGDLVVAFDPAEQQFNLDQARSELAEADEEIAKLAADTKVQAATDQVAQLHERFAVRQAEIAVSGNEFEGAIKARMNLLDLDAAKQSLAKVEDDIRTHAATNDAQAVVLKEKRQKALLAIQFATHNIESMRVTSPIAGLVVVKENQSAAGGFFFEGMSLPEYHEGDTAQPGSVIADIVDLGTIGLKAKVSETDRSSLASDTVAAVRLEGVPGDALPGSTSGVSGLATRDFWDVSVERQFEATFALKAPGSALRPGMTAGVEVQGERLKNVVHIPRQALFDRLGKPVVFVRNGPAFTATPVKVARLTESRAVIEGLPVDTEIALADPDKNASSTGAKSAGPAVGGAQ